MKLSSLRVKKSNFNEIINKYVIFIVLLLMIVFMSIMKPMNFPTANNFMNIVRSMTPIAIVALGMTMLIISGGVDLSVGAMVGFSSSIAAMLSHPAGADPNIGQFPLIMALTIPFLMTGLFGAINGIVVSFGGVPPFIATLGMYSVLKGIAMIITQGKPISIFTNQFTFIGGGSVLGIPLPIWVYGLLAVICAVAMRKTIFGSHVYAVGCNESAAIVSGINVKRIRISVYTITGLLSGVAGIILASRTLAGQATYGTGLDMDSITCVIIGGVSFSGGVGSIFGGIVGAMLLGVLINGMTMLMIDANIQIVLKGLVILIAVLADSLRNRKKF